jgi:hypothetical protein
VACVALEFVREVPDPMIAVAFRNGVRHTIYVPRSDSGVPLGTFPAGQRSVVRFEFPNWLAPSLYSLSPTVFASDKKRVLDSLEDVASLRVDGPRYTGGVADIPARVEVVPG